MRSESGERILTCYHAGCYHGQNNHIQHPHEHFSRKRYKYDGFFARIRFPPPNSNDDSKEHGKYCRQKQDVRPDPSFALKHSNSTNQEMFTSSNFISAKIQNQVMFSRTLRYCVFDLIIRAHHINMFNRV